MEVGQVCFITNCTQQGSTPVRFATTLDTEVHNCSQGLAFDVLDTTNFSARQ